VRHARPLARPADGRAVVEPRNNARNPGCKRLLRDDRSLLDRGECPRREADTCESQEPRRRRHRRASSVRAGGARVGVARGASRETDRSAAVSGQSDNKPAGRFTVEPTASNHFAWLNTRLAIERTFMAWIRTSV